MLSDTFPQPHKPWQHLSPKRGSASSGSWQFHVAEKQIRVNIFHFSRGSFINPFVTGHKNQTPARLKGKHALGFLFPPGSLNYPASSCITCCLNHPDKLIPMPDTHMEDIILSLFSLEPRKSPSLHCKDRAGCVTPPGCSVPGRTHVSIQCPSGLRVTPGMSQEQRRPHGQEHTHGHCLLTPPSPGQLLPSPRRASQVCTDLCCWVGRGHGPRNIQTSSGKA